MIFFFVDRKLIVYFCYLIIASVFTIYILFNLNSIIKWINPNTLNSIIQASNFFYFFNDDDNFIPVILLKPTKQINLYRFKIHIFYRKFKFHTNSAKKYYFI